MCVCFLFFFGGGGGGSVIKLGLVSFVAVLFYVFFLSFISTLYFSDEFNLNLTPSK